MHLVCTLFRARWIGASPEKSDLVNSRVRTKENLVNSVFCRFSWEKSTKCSQNPGLVNEFSVTPRGRLNWTGPIANSSELLIQLISITDTYFGLETNYISATMGICYCAARACLSATLFCCISDHLAWHILCLGDKIQGPSWGQQKRRKPPLWHLLDPRLEVAWGGLKWFKVASSGFRWLKVA